MQRLAAAVAPIAVLGVVACAPTHPEVRHIVASDQPRPTGLGESVAALHELRRVAAAPSSPVTTPDERRNASAPVSRSRITRPTGDIWGALARCESGMRNDRGPRYYGYFHFLPATWTGLGYAGLPSDHSYEAQRAAAARLVQRSGWGQFPGCARKLGLR